MAILQLAGCTEQLHAWLLVMLKVLALYPLDVCYFVNVTLYLNSSCYWVIDESSKDIASFLFSFMLFQPHILTLH